MNSYPFVRSLLSLGAIIMVLAGAICVAWGIHEWPTGAPFFYIATGISGFISAAVLQGFSTVIMLLTDIRNGVGAGRNVGGPVSADCPGCGGRVLAGAAKCNHCGYRLK